MKTAPLLLLLLGFGSLQARAATTLGVSDIMFCGYSSIGTTEDFSFVTFVTLEADTQIRFSDRPWNGTAFDTSNTAGDGEIQWTSSSDLPAGSVVVISMTTSNSIASVSSGNATGGFGTTGLSTGGEIIFAFQGTTASPSFVHALNYRAVYDTPTAGDTLDSLKPTTLDVANGDVLFPTAADNGQFDARSSQSTLGAYKAALSNPANWTVSDTEINLVTTGFTAVPEASSLLFAMMGAALMARRRR